MSERLTAVALRTGRSLTQAQRSLWASQLQNPTAPVQNMVEVAHLSAVDGVAVDPVRLAAAFVAVVEGSDALRTRIISEQGEPRVVVAPAGPWVTSTILALSRADALAWCQRRVHTPIDMSVGPFDSAILTHPDNSITWYLGLHHTVTDATSSSLVFNATAAAYYQQPFETGSYYHWADARLGQDDRRAERSRSFWRDRSAPPALGQLYAGDRPATTTSHRVSVELDRSLLAQLDLRLEDDLRMLSSDLAWSTLLLTATSTLIHRISGADAFSVGLPVHHRNEPSARQLIGPVMQVYPVDIAVEPADTFRSLYSRVGRSVLTTIQHAGPSGAPLNPDFRVVMNLLPKTDQQWFGPHRAEVTWLHPGATDPAHLLRVQFTRFGDEPQLHLDLNEAAADVGQGHSAAGHFRAVLAAIASDPDLPIGSLTLPASDERGLIEQWGTGGQALAGGELVVPLLRRALSHNGGPAMEAHPPAGVESVLTGRQVWSRAVALARWLRDQGVGPGQRVAIDLARSVDAVVAIYATLLAGGSYVPLDPTHPPERRRRLIERAGCRVVLDGLPGSVWPPSAVQSEDSDPLPDLEWPLPAEDDEAYLLFTSGSTGEPKGVPISHRGLADYLAFAGDAYVPSGALPVGALFTALTFDLTVTALFVPVLAGGRLVVIEAEGPAGIRQLVDCAEVTWAKATPSHLELLVRLLAERGTTAAATVHGLRSLVVGGEAFGAQLAHQLWAQLPDLEIFNEYGPTEAVVGCMIHQANPVELLERVDVPIGGPAPGVELRILDQYDQPVPIGASGELHISHRGVTTGYLDAADGDGRFVELDGRRFYRSGDLVRLSDPQTLSYLGRLDEQMKVGGIRLDPTEVEHALAAHPAVDRAVVRLWQPKETRPTHHCVQCGLPDNLPGATFDDLGVCATCHAYEAIREQAEVWFRTPHDLLAIQAKARTVRGGKYDAIHLLSGGKDSTYALYQLVELGFEVLCLTLDNGFISAGALENVRRSVADLGIDHEILTSDHMNEVFRDSLDRFSNVCHGCYKTIYTLATQKAVEVGAPLIFTGLSRGQLFETRLIPEQFSRGRFDAEAIDAATLQARRVYHRLDDGTNRLLDTSVFAADAFDDGDVFDRVSYLDFYRYVDVELAEMLEFLDKRAPWVRPSDTGRSTNCLVNAAGIHTHLVEQGFHNYAVPYAWDVRLGHKTRIEAMEELDDQLDLADVGQMLDVIGYRPTPRQLLTAWIETRIGEGEGRPDGAELRTFLAERLPSHAIPGAFVMVDEVPLTSNGKVDSARLPAPQRVHRAGPSLYVSAQTPLEETVVAVWERLLGVEPIGVDDDFFGLGGDSLAALKMVVELSMELGRTVREDLAFAHTTPRLLAEAIEFAASEFETKALPDDPPDAPHPTARPADTPPPLSPGEQALLFEQYLNPVDPRYNVGRRYTIAGPVDGDRFHSALLSVVGGHVPLHWTYSDPRRRLTPVAAIAVDVRPTTAALDDFVAESRRLHLEPFDLDAGPLGRCLVQPLEGGTTGITLIFHHVSIDAVTFDDLWTQVDDRYRDGAGLESGGVESFDYADHTSWQRGRAQRRAGDKQFWSDDSRPAVPAGLNFGTTSSTDGYVHRAASFTLDRLRVGAGSTAFATALTGLLVALRPHADGDQLGIAITASTRDHPGATNLVGYYLNTLPLVVPASSGSSLAEVGQLASNAIGRALAHRTYPFAQMVTDRRMASLPPPSASVILAFEELAPATLGACTAEHEVLATGSAVTDATFFVQGRGQSVMLGLEYSGQTMDEATAVRLLEDLDRSISAAIDQPSTLLGEVVGGLLPAAARVVTGVDPAVGAPDLTDELGQILTDWNNTAAPLSADITVQAAFERQVAVHPEKPAVVFEHLTLSYADLDRRANLLAGDLRHRGLGAGARVGLVARRHPDTVIGAFGILKAGAVYVPIDPDYPADRITHITEDADVRVILDSPDLADDGRPDPGRPTPASGEADLAYVIFTSGSTGRPKGVMVSHRNIIESTAARAGIYDGPVGRFLLLSSFSFDSAMVGLFWTLSTGGTLVLPNRGLHTDIAHLGSLVERQQVTHSLALPSLYRLLLDDAEPAQLGSLRTVIVAGESCPPTLGPLHHQRCPEAGLWNEYGPTETTVWSHVYRVAAMDRVAAMSSVGVEGPAAASSVPIGRPINNTVAHVLDENLRVVGVGQPGQLYLGGVGVTAGYVNRPDLTAESFVLLPAELDDGLLHYRTGDLVRWLPSGDLEFLGRIDHQVKIRGYRIELGEVETAALEQDLVREAVADAIDGRAAGQRQLALWVAAGPDADRLAADELRRGLAQRLPAFMVPQHVVVLPELPRTPNGKVDRAALPDPLGEPSLSRAGDLERGADGGFVGQVEELMAEIWAEVLGFGTDGSAPLERNDDFFDLGGDSIMSIQIVSRLRRHGWQVSTRDVFDHPSIAQLAQRARPLGAVTAEQDALSGATALLPIQRWFLSQPLANRHHWNQSRWVDLADGADVNRLLNAASQLSEHHDALRLRFVTEPDGSVTPTFASEASVHVSLVTGAGLDLRIAAAEAAEAGLNIETGPLMTVTGFTASAGMPAQLFVSVHHLVMDAVSWSPLLEDWAALYRDGGARLPAKTTSVRQWARHLETWQSTDAFLAERSRWQGGFLDPVPHGLLEADTELVSVDVPCPSVVDELQILAAVGHGLAVAGIGEPSPVIMVEAHGREAELADDIDLSRTIGWFTTHHPVWVAVGATGQETLAQLRAADAPLFKGLGFGLAAPAAAGQIPVLLNFLGRTDRGSSSSELFASVGPLSAGVAGDNPRLHRLGVMAQITGDHLTLVFDHHPHQLSYEQVQAAADATALALAEIFEAEPTPPSPTSPESSESPFDLVELSADELGSLSDLLDNLDT